MGETSILTGTLECDRRGRHERSDSSDPIHFVLLGGPDDKPQIVADTLNCDFMLTLEEQEAIMERLAKCWNEHARLTEENERLRKASEWQPIETAPKDGTHVLIYPALFRVPCVATWEGNWAKGYWRLAMTQLEPPYKPTHWKSVADIPTDIARSALSDEGDPNEPSEQPLQSWF